MYKKLLTNIKLASNRCWLWKGVPNKNGYGMIGKERNYVHRVSYETFIGPIPKGLLVHHKCYNKLCINPAHLEVLTYAQHNMKPGHTPVGESHYLTKRKKQD